MKIDKRVLHGMREGTSRGIKGLGRQTESEKGTRDEGGSSGRGNYNKRRREDNRLDEKEKPEEIRGVVTMIAGGFCGGGETSSAWRKYVRSVMSGIKPHEDDPMVIDIVMAKYKVQRVLVDQGSSADILYWSTFQRLQIPQEWLLPFSGSLIGFAGDSVEVRGYVDVMTTFGEGKHKKTNRDREGRPRNGSQMLQG
ncbi:hypothetical protein SESBI_21659 [Sesbania bispinosa]|nr:hypothetical protein SESBI_21659 [Sesbania bispinosa]